MAIDKLSIISGTLFFTSIVLAICSLVMPNWIVSSIVSREGNKKSETRIGLLYSCISIFDREPMCFKPSPLRPEWAITFITISVGVICIAVAIVLLIVSHWRRYAVRVARWLGFLGMVLFCIAAILFPTGFDMEQIGGASYQLPDNFQIGLSYILFVLALWNTVIAELFAGKVCLPHF